MKGLRILGIIIFSGLLLAVLGIVVQPAAATSPYTPSWSMGSTIAEKLNQKDVLAPQPVMGNTSQPTSTLCRLGYAGTFDSLRLYPAAVVQPLRAEWLLSWGLSGWHNITEDMRLGPSVWVKQWKQVDGQLVQTHYNAPYAEPFTYTIRPSIPEIKQIVAQHSGQVWLVGNEIERRDWAWYKSDGSVGGSLGQQEILPELYAQVYHQVYHAIKEVDPTARVANGSIVLPTPLRLEYMTRMWDEYYRLYHTDMPVDIWQIHLYLLQEKRGDFGADIPAGIDDDEGWFVFDTFTETWMLNKDFSHVPGLVRDFRVWMEERGQQNKPLFITEMAVMAPDWVMPGEFTPEKIRDEFLYPTMDMIFQTTDPVLGYPDDDFHLVQSMWWWSFNMDYGSYQDGNFYQAYNGNLVWSGLGPPDHAPNPRGLSQLGEYWIDKVSLIDAQPNLRPHAIQPLTASSHSGKPITATLQLKIINNSEIAATPPFTVTFRHHSTGRVIDRIIINDVVEGCGDIYSTVDIQWPDLTPGVHNLRVLVDDGNAVVENDETDNVRIFPFFVGGYQVRLPVLMRR